MSTCVWRPSPAEAASRRALQVSRLLAASAAAHPPAPYCTACAFQRSFCICPVLQAQRLRFMTPLHDVVVILHPRELQRNSTHRVLAGAACATVLVADSPTDGAPSAIWASVLEACKLDGRIPAVLYPSPTARTVREVREGLSPAERARGLRCVVLDGTWSEARALSRALPPDVPFITLGDSTSCGDSLFSPCRVQPQPSRVCTAEAVACVFDEWRASASAAAASSFAAAPPRDALGDALRLCVEAHVDAQVRQSGLLGGPHSRGTGYRSWTLGEAVGPLLGKLPAKLLITISDFAYGQRSFARSGYFARRREDGGGCPLWAAHDAATASAVVATAAAAGVEPPLPPAWGQSVLARAISHGGLPRLEGRATPPLALTCKALLCLAAGLCLEAGAIERLESRRAKTAHECT